MAVISVFVLTSSRAAVNARNFNFTEIGERSAPDGCRDDCASTRAGSCRLAIRPARVTAAVTPVVFVEHGAAIKTLRRNDLVFHLWLQPYAVADDATVVTNPSQVRAQLFTGDPCISLKRHTTLWRDGRSAFPEGDGGLRCANRVGESRLTEVVLLAIGNDWVHDSLSAPLLSLSTAPLMAVQKAVD